MPAERSAGTAERERKSLWQCPMGEKEKGINDLSSYTDSVSQDQLPPDRLS